MLSSKWGTYVGLLGPTQVRRLGQGQGQDLVAASSAGQGLVAPQTSL